MKNSTITKLRKIIREEISKVKKYRVNEANRKKVTKQMWAKMDYDERVNALLSFFKDPDDAEKYGDSDWNNLPSGADGGMYIFESINEANIAMRPSVERLLKQKGYDPIFQTIDKSKRDFKRLGYTKGEIEETLFDMFGNIDPKIVKKIKESFEHLNEANEESGLYVYPSTRIDFKKLEKWLKNSAYYAEVDSNRGYVFFPEEKENYDSLEIELDKEFNKARISARFEGK
jgi:hypothetical protein